VGISVWGVTVQVILIPKMRAALFSRKFCSYAICPLLRRKINGYYRDYQCGRNIERKNWLFHDEGKVEEVLIKELQANFQERGIKANLFSVTGLDMLGNGRLEVNVNVRSANMMS